MGKRLFKTTVKPEGDITSDIFGLRQNAISTAVEKFWKAKLAKTGTIKSVNEISDNTFEIAITYKGL